jgi:hypothetical protein
LDSLAYTKLTYSGLTAKQVLRASGATAASFQALNNTDLTYTFASGSIGYAGSANPTVGLTELAIGASTTILTSSGSAPQWSTVTTVAGTLTHNNLGGLTTGDPHTQYTAKATLTTTGDIYYASSANTPARLAIGSVNDILRVSGGIPAWTSLATELTTLATTSGDMLYNSGATTARLAVGSNGQVLQTASSLPAWSTNIAGVSGGRTIYGGSAASDALTIESTSNATKGNTTHNAAAHLFLSTGTEMARINSSGLGLGTTPSYLFHISKTVSTDAVGYLTGITTSSSAYTQVWYLAGGLTGAPATQAMGLQLAPYCQPSASIPTFAGLYCQPVAYPNTSKNITTFIGAWFKPVMDKTGTGAITTMIGFYVSPTYLTGAPTNSYGIQIPDIGNASITTAICIDMTVPSAGTNKAYFGFSAGTAAAPTGLNNKIPVWYAGALKYIGIYDS